MNNVLEITIDLPFIKSGTRFIFNEKSGDIFRPGEDAAVNISIGAYLWLLRKERAFSDAELLANNIDPKNNPYKYFKTVEDIPNGDIYNH